MWWYTVTIVIGCIGIASCNPVEQIQDPWEHYGNQCGTAASARNMWHMCGYEDDHQFKYRANETVTAQTIEDKVGTCSHWNVDFCAKDVTLDCSVKDQAMILDLGRGFYNRCSDNGWIQQYVIPGYAEVAWSCLVLRGMCDDAPFPEFTIEANTPIADIVEYLELKADVAFACIKEHAMAMAGRPGCTAAWQDMFFTYLVHVTNVELLVMFPEQIQKMAEIRRSQEAEHLWQ